METKKIQTLYAKKMFNQVIKEVTLKPLAYEVMTADQQATAVIVSYQEWQKLQSQRQQS